MKVQKLWAFLFFMLVVSMVFPVAAFAGGTIKGNVKAPRKKYSKNCVVFIEKVSGNFTAKEKAKMEQQGLVFIPHVLPVLKGTTIEFYNYDDVLHNVFSPDEIAGKFNLGTWPKGEVKTFTFDNVGSAVLLCNVHAEMEGYIVVLENPYFAVTGKDGNYTINDVPAGSYTVAVWSEKYKTLTEKVDVTDGGNATVDFKLKKKK